MTAAPGRAWGHGCVSVDYADPGARHTRWHVTNVVKYHRTTATVLSPVLDSGLMLTALSEPTPAIASLAEHPACQANQIIVRTPSGAGRFDGGVVGSPVVGAAPAAGDGPASGRPASRAAAATESVAEGAASWATGTPSLCRRTVPLIQESRSAGHTAIRNYPYRATSVSGCTLCPSILPDEAAATRLPEPLGQPPCRRPAHFCHCQSGGCFAGIGRDESAGRSHWPRLDDGAIMAP